MSFLCSRGSPKQDYDNENFRPSSLSATTSPQSKISSPSSPHIKVEKTRSPFSLFRFSTKTKAEVKLDDDFRNDGSPILDRKPSSINLLPSAAIADENESSSISYRIVREFSLDLDTSSWKWSTRKVYYPLSREAVVRSVFFHHNGVWMWDKEIPSEPIQNFPAEKEESSLLSERSEQNISSTVSGSESPVALPISNLTHRRKVFSLQATTGEYAWEYFQGTEKVEYGYGLSEQVAVAVPVKIFSESDGVWGWRSADSSYSPQQIAVTTSQFQTPSYSSSSSSSSTSSPQQQLLQTSGNGEGKGEHSKPAATATATRSPLQAVRMGVSRIYDSVFSPNLKDKNQDSHSTPSRADSSPAPSSLPSTMSPAAAEVEYAPPESVSLTYEEVKRGVILPPNIDPRIRELYLEDEKFQALFKMDKKEFMAMKKWKRDELKKKVDIF